MSRTRTQSTVPVTTTVGSSTVADDAESRAPPAKKSRGLFSHYKPSSAASTTTRTNPQQELLDYINTINDPQFDADAHPLSRLSDQYPTLKPLFEATFCAPASSAPVERVFSKSGLIMRPHRARMSDAMLEMLVFLACNKDL